VSAYDVRYLDHPSDIGIEADGATCAQAFCRAAAALISLILDPSTVQSSVSRTITLHATDAEQLLVRWLSEILYLYDGQGFAPGDFQITVCTPTLLEATVAGEAFDAEKHTTRGDVKAITYHQTAVWRDGGTWHVRAYVDL
jgi:SHS2 domain-containing protein